MILGQSVVVTMCDRGKDTTEAYEPVAEPEMVTIKLEPLDCDDNEEEQPTGVTPHAPDPLSSPAFVKVETYELMVEPLSDEESVEQKTQNQSLAEGVNSKLVPSAPATNANASAANPPLANPDNECHLCHKTYATPSSLTRHLLNHKRVNFDCPHCDRQFFSPASFERHIAIHNKPSSYDCPTCKKSFKTTSKLNMHQKRHWDNKPYNCTVCERGFPVNYLYKKHIEAGKCLPPSALVCTECGEQFERVFELLSHVETHDSVRPFRCEHCEMTFPNNCTLVWHSQVHNNTPPSSLVTDENPNECKICGKIFSRKPNMERHKKKHDKVKLLECFVCAKRFHIESRLKYHLRIHLADELPFQCTEPNCLKRFAQRGNIKKHYQRKHPGSPFTCDLTDADIAKRIWEKLMRERDALLGIKAGASETKQGDDVEDSNESSSDELLSEGQERIAETKAPEKTLPSVTVPEISIKCKNDPENSIEHEINPENSIEHELDPKNSINYEIVPETAIVPDISIKQEIEIVPVLSNSNSSIMSEVSIEPEIETEISIKCEIEIEPDIY